MLRATKSTHLKCPSVRQLDKRCAGTATGPEKIFRVNKVGNREVVGFGINGKPGYSDNIAIPFPSIKFRELTPEFKALEEKAKGDWKKLTIAEKKQLYRINYCQTLAEAEAPTGEWKSVIGFGLIMVSLGLWLHMFIEYVRIESKGGRIISLSEEHRRAQLKRMIDLAVDPVDGLSSKWDYEKNMWKADVAKLEQKK